MSQERAVVDAATEQTIAEIKRIRSMFIGTYRRLYKNEALAPFQNDESLSVESRLLAIEAIENAYANVVWEDDVTGIEIDMLLDVVIHRLYWPSVDPS